ncbi:MAG: hypothetical protein WA631_08060 [Nitrososphaeraceae archaeon]
MIFIRHHMGAVFRPKHLARGHRKIIDNAKKDFTPDTKDNVIKVLDSWKGKESEERLKEILGQDKAQELLKNIESKRKDKLR